MRQYPPYVNDSNVVSVVREIMTLRREDINEVDGLGQNKLKGRNRNGVRAVPTSATDVVSGDIEGDVVVDATYRYELVDVAGTGLRWRIEELDVSW